MIKEKIIAVLDALAVGDAVGMPTEFMTRQAIKNKFGAVIDGIIPSAQSQNHSELPTASVTDDTEQNLYLLRAYAERGELTVADTVHGLLRWVKETGAVEKRYIGPSSMKALDEIIGGADYTKTGLNGTTCGGIMRVPAVVLFCPAQTEEALRENIYKSLLPTHNTSQALEAAGAYGFALQRALGGADFREIVESACRGADLLIAKAPYIACAPSSKERIKNIMSCSSSFDEEELLDWAYGVLGTGLPSADACAAVFLIFKIAGKDVWKAIRLGASIGGDTDTIAALAGALCAAYAGDHNIPSSVMDTVRHVNSLDNEKIACAIVEGVHC